MGPKLKSKVTYLYYWGIIQWNYPKRFPSVTPIAFSIARGRTAPTVPYCKRKGRDPGGMVDSTVPRLLTRRKLPARGDEQLQAEKN